MNDLSLIYYKNTFDLYVKSDDLILPFFIDLNSPIQDEVDLIINTLQEKIEYLTSIPLVKKQTDNAKIQSCKEDYLVVKERIIEFNETLYQLVRIRPSGNLDEYEDKDCQLTMNPFSISRKYNRMIRTLNSLIQDLNKVNTDLNAGTTVTAAAKNGARFAYCTGATQIVTQLLLAIRKAERRVLIYEECINERIPREVLIQINTLSCIKNSGVLDTTVIDSCRQLQGGLQCDILIASSERKTRVKSLSPTKFLVKNRVLSLRFENEENLIEIEKTGLMANMNDCTRKRETILICNEKTFQFKGNQCLEAIHGQKINDVINYCKIFTRSSEKDPVFITHTEMGIFVAELNSQSVIILLGNKGIYDTPVLIENKEDLKISYLGKTSIIKGRTNRDANILHTSTFNSTVLEKLYDAAEEEEGMKFDFLPNNWSNFGLLANYIIDAIAITFTIVHLCVLRKVTKTKGVKKKVTFSSMMEKVGRKKKHRSRSRSRSPSSSSAERDETRPLKQRDDLDRIERTNEQLQRAQRV